MESPLRADGIALSTDGLVWAKGAGSYGNDWGVAGTGITIRQGGTLYIKYYSSREEAALSFADHGRKWGEWRVIGPVLTDNLAIHPNAPVVLRISDIGTPKSRVAWVNGRGRSGIWSGLSAPGAYDLALHEAAKWTLPPIVVTAVPKPTFWSNFLREPEPIQTTRSARIQSVPEDGFSAGLFVLALLSLAIAHRTRL